MIKALMLGVAMCVAIPAAAQEKEPGKAVSVELVKFKPGTTERVNEIENKYFTPAAEKTGIRPIVIRMASGEWDRAYIFPMPGGMASLDYRGTKEQLAWMAEVDTLAGGKGMAQKLLTEWNSAIASRRTDYGFSDQK